MVEPLAERHQALALFAERLLAGKSGHACRLILTRSDSMPAVIWVGTSGYQYPEWRGSFYPPGLPTDRMLAYYVERFSTVEINYTARHFPSEKTLLSWRNATPDRFTFSLKAPLRVTEMKRLVGAEADTRAFLDRVSLLGDKLGVIVFKLEVDFDKDLARLDAFLGSLPPGTRAAFEFRKPEWHTDDVFRCLRAHDVALCVSDTESLRTPLVRTAAYGYFRLRDEGYTPADLARWADVLSDWHAAAPDDDVYVYFKHEAAGKGPEFGRQLLELLEPASLSSAGR